jgi:hypothetical protein
VRRLASGAFSAMLFAAAVCGQESAHGSAYGSIDRWLDGAPRADLHWFVNAEPAALSRYQRLRTRFVIGVQQDEMARRSGHGRLLMMIRVRDRDGKVYDSEHLVDLRQSPFTTAQKLSRTDWISTAFLIPGDYQVSFALADLDTGAHNLARRKLRVPPLSGDPLPDAWRGLPAFEFIAPVDPPENWFLPQIRSRLHLPLETARPVRVQVVVNASVSETSPLAQRRTSQTLALLVGALRTLSEIDVRNGTLSLTLLDIARRREIFRQDTPGALDWSRLRPALDADNQRTIDAGDLKNRAGNARYFVRQIAERIDAPAGDPALRVLIVLTPPVDFPPGTDRTPIEPPAHANYRVFYIRYQTVSAHGGIPATFAGMPYALPRPQPLYRLPRPLPDQLADTIKPLHPRVFEVFTPLDFRKALGAILREISAH